MTFIKNFRDDLLDEQQVGKVIFKDEIVARACRAICTDCNCIHSIIVPCP